MIRRVGITNCKDQRENLEPTMLSTNGETCQLKKKDRFTNSDSLNDFGNQAAEYSNWECRTDPELAAQYSQSKPLEVSRRTMRSI
jgi:hypothetical protein